MWYGQGGGRFCLMVPLCDSLFHRKSGCRLKVALDFCPPELVMPWVKKNDIRVFILFCYPLSYAAMGQTCKNTSLLDNFRNSNIAED